jgi:CTP:molybdopterin cytidylyltransferase MocA
MNDKIIPIILAAGKSKRFGKENKLFYTIKNKKILELTLEVFLNSFKSIIVVIGHDKEDMVEFLSFYDPSRVNYIHNDKWDLDGMSSSVKKGIEFIKSSFNCFGILIHPGDVPFITETDIKSIVAKAEQESFQKLIIPQFEMKNGHPLFIPKPLLSQVLKISESSEGLRGFLKKNHSLITFVQCSKGVLRDIDYKTDLD